MKLLALLSLILSLCGSLSSKEHLPQSLTFIGKEKFDTITTKAIQNNWYALPIGDRMATIAQELRGTPYKGHTLEIHNHIESPSVNFRGLDCWTFFETVLGMAKMLETPRRNYTPSQLLAEIEHTRYRGGTCHGNYLDRIHYLVEWFSDNHQRRNIRDITRKFPTVTMPNRCEEMSLLWRHYRYLKHNPALRPLMAQQEKQLTARTLRMIPKHKVKAIEHQLQNGDIIGIARKDNGSYCSHVGIIVVDAQGTRRFMHASTTYKKVVIDTSISDYLHKFSKHAGILVARPL